MSTVYAYISSIFIGIICGILGVIIYEKNWLIISGGIAHTAFGGIGIALYAGFNPMIGAAGFSLGSAVLIANKYKEKTDITISILWAAGMAIGTIFYSLSDNQTKSIGDYLFGDISAMSANDFIYLVIMTVGIMFLLIMFYNVVLFYLSDREYCSIRGINVKLIDNILLIIISLSIVSMLRMLGIILVIALLSAPIATAVKFTSNFMHRIILSAAISVISVFIGVLSVEYFGINSGASIALVACLIYFASSFICKIRDKKTYI